MDAPCVGRPSALDAIVRQLGAPRMQPSWVAAVFLGGVAGTAVRFGLESTFSSPPTGWPWATFWINITGSLALAALLEVLARGGPLTGWRRLLRLGVGTGFLGGYTTYSAFSVEAVTLLGSDAWLMGLGYALSSVVLGVAAALSGAGLVRWLLPAKRSEGAV